MVSPLEGRLSSVTGGQRRNGRSRPKRFSSVEHLSHEAVAAFVDGELSASAEHRARVHVVQCPECRAEVHGQRGAAEMLRGCNLSAHVRAPEDLLAKLAGIAHSNLGPGPDAEATPVARPEDFMDRVETVFRTIRKMQGKGQR